MKDHSMAKYLVTGGAGFIGCNLVRFLVEKNQQVVVLDDFSTGRRENLAGLEGKIELHEADIRDRRVVDRAIAGCAGVFHEAALGSVPRSVADPATTHDVNVNGTITLLESARAAGVRRIIFAASSSAYGDRNESPKHEDMVPLPISPYAASKVACEAYMRGYSAVYGLEALSLRYFNVFGPYQDPRGAYAAVIPIFVSMLLKGKAPTIDGDGEQSRDFCYIDNVCQANWLAMQAKAEVCDGRILNIACRHATSVNQVFGRIRELLGSKLQPVYGPKRTGDVRDSLASVDLARKTIGYEPRIFFDEGLSMAIDWYKANLS